MQNETAVINGNTTNTIRKSTFPSDKYRNIEITLRIPTTELTFANTNKNKNKKKKNGINGPLSNVMFVPERSASY